MITATVSRFNCQYSSCVIEIPLIKAYTPHWNSSK